MSKDKLPRWILEEGETTEEESDLSPADRQALGVHVGQYAASRGAPASSPASSPKAPAPVAQPKGPRPLLPIPLAAGDVPAPRDKAITSWGGEFKPLVVEAFISPAQPPQASPFEDQTLAELTIGAAREVERSGDPEAFAGLEAAVREFFESGGERGLPHIWGRRALPEELATLVGERAHARRVLLALARSLGKPLSAVTLADLKAASDREASRNPQILEEVFPLWEEARALGEEEASIQWESWKESLGLVDEAHEEGREAPPIPPLSSPPAPASSPSSRFAGDLEAALPSMIRSAFLLGYKLGKEEGSK